MRQNCKFLYLISKTKCLYERIRNTGAGISGQVKLEGRSSELMRSLATSDGYALYKLEFG
ncbi:MAG: hypothetical protein ACJ71J_01120 [Nitrososphaeraceae archaeon]